MTKLNGSIIHGGREYHAGTEIEKIPGHDKIDMKRMERLELIGEPKAPEPAERSNIRK